VAEHPVDGVKAVVRAPKFDILARLVTLSTDKDSDQPYPLIRIVIKRKDLMM